MRRMLRVRLFAAPILITSRTNKMNEASVQVHSGGRCLMNRREFLQTGTAGLALSATGGYGAAAGDNKRPRVGLIGCGWYGKVDLLRLIQVAPVEVVSLCDV